MWLQVLRRVEEIEARPAGGSGPADVVVVGAGYAGVELASTVAERLGTRAAVQLVSAGFAPLLPPSSLPLAWPHAGAYLPAPLTSYGCAVTILICVCF